MWVVLSSEALLTGPYAVRDWLAEVQSGQQLRYSFIHCADLERAGARRDWLLAAHQRAESEGYSATDDAGLLHWAGHAVTLVPGEASLFKVTTSGDLLLAEALAAVWDA